MKKSDLVLYVIILFLVLSILTGTILGLSMGHRPAENLRDSDPAPSGITNLNRHNPEKLAAFSDLGTIRTVTKPYPTSENPEDSGTTVVVTPWLSYSEGDTVFFEELSRKRLVIKGIIKTYFTGYTQKELLSKTEEKIKEDLKELINQKLSLGEIYGVYFSDYIFLQ